LAAYYDKLAGSALDSGGNAALTGQGIGIFNGVIADGFVPSRVTVTVNDTNRLWYGVAATFVDSAATDSVQVVALWSDTAASTIVLAGYAQNVLTEAQAIVRGGDVNTIVADSVDSGSTVLGLTDNVCKLTTITNVYPSVPTYDPGSFNCQAGSGHFDFAVTLPSGDQTATGAIQSITVATSTIISVRLQGLSEGVFTQRVPRGRILGLMHRRR
jgi:hypothetical protein